MPKPAKQVNFGAIRTLASRSSMSPLPTRLADESRQTTSPAMLLFSAFVWIYPTAPSMGSSLEEEEAMRVFSLCRTSASFQCNIKETNKQDRIGTYQSKCQLFLIKRWPSFISQRMKRHKFHTGASTGTFSSPELDKSFPPRPTHRKSRSYPSAQSLSSRFTHRFRTADLRWLEGS